MDSTLEHTEASQEDKMSGKLSKIICMCAAVVLVLGTIFWMSYGSAPNEILGKAEETIKQVPMDAEPQKLSDKVDNPAHVTPVVQPLVIQPPVVHATKLSTIIRPILMVFAAILTLFFFFWLIKYRYFTEALPDIVEPDKTVVVDDGSKVDIERNEGGAGNIEAESESSSYTWIYPVGVLVFLVFIAWRLGLFSKPHSGKPSAPPNVNQKVAPIKLTFKDEYTIDQRTATSKNMRTKHPNLIPVILEPAGETIKPTKGRFMVSSDLTVIQMNQEARKYTTEIKHNERFYLYGPNGDLLEDDMTMQALDAQFKDPEDGFLYLGYLVREAPATATTATGATISVPAITAGPPTTGTTGTGAT